MSLPTGGARADARRLARALVGSLLAHLLGVGVLLALPPGPRATPTLLEARPVQVWQALPAPSPRWAAPIPEVRPPEPPTGPAARPRVPVPPAAVPRQGPAGRRVAGAGAASGAVRPERRVVRERRGAAPGPHRAAGRLRPASHRSPSPYDSPPPSLPPPPASNPPAPPTPRALADRPDGGRPLPGSASPAAPAGPSPALTSQPETSIAEAGEAAVHGAESTAGSGAVAAGRASVRTGFLTPGQSRGGGTDTNHGTATGTGEVHGGTGPRRGEAPGGAGGDHGGRGTNGGVGGALSPGGLTGAAGAGSGSGSGGSNGSADGGPGGEGPSGPPTLQYEAPPAYPAEAARDGIQGTVRVRAHVDTEGQVTAVEVVSSSGDSRLDEAARVAALAWRFRPATRGGRPVAAWVTRNVRFALDGRSWLRSSKARGRWYRAEKTLTRRPLRPHPSAASTRAEPASPCASGTSKEWAARQWNGHPQGARSAPRSRKFRPGRSSEENQ